MKKRYLIAAVLGLILGFWAKIDYWFVDERDVFFPITKEDLRVSKKMIAEQMPSNKNPEVQAK